MSAAARSAAGRTPIGRRLAPLLLAGALGAGCGESNDVVYTADRVVVWDESTASTTTVPAVLGTIVIERIWSPENGIAELSGVGATVLDPVTVDDRPADVIGFDVDASGAFTIRVRIAQEGNRTVCVRDECGRVFVDAPVGADGAT